MPTKKPVRGEFHKADRPRLDLPQRNCACCGDRFQPTIRRRMLCSICFKTDGNVEWTTTESARGGRGRRRRRCR